MSTRTRKGFANMKQAAVVRSQSREVWLLNAVEELRPHFEKAGFDFPNIVHVSMGFPSTRPLSANKQRIGECWPTTCSTDGNPQIFISPVIVDGVRALDVLVHELGHAATPGAGHKGAFVKFMRAIGLEGKATATVAGEGLNAKLEAVITRIGPYPHFGLKASALAKKKQTTRMLKVVCPKGGDEDASEHADYIVRMSRSTIDELGTPLCPSCGEVMEEDASA